ncbi:MAG TPA: hypothetical protein VMZ31_19445 [Phycisphaerae bacterium]|nr:hypothetical protein [Phycisphaerae bacterium]
MLDRIKTAATVVVLTCLIWFSADQYNQGELRRTVKVRIAPRTGSDRIISGVPEDLDVTAVLGGPNRLIRELEAELTAGMSPITYWIGDDVPTGSHTVWLRQALSEDPRLKGLIVRGVSPARVNLQVDRLLWREAPVKLETGRYGVTETEIQPPQVRVRLPESVLTTLQPQRLQATADLRELLQSQPADKVVELTGVPVTADRAMKAVAVDPERVTVRLRISLKRKKLTGVVVFFSASQSLLAKYVPQTANDVVDVAVVGPHHVIDDLAPQEVDARVTVSVDDYRPDGTSVTHPVAFTFPPGVKLDQDPPAIEFRLAERSVSLRP